MVSSSEFQSTVGEVITLPPRTHLRVAVMKRNDEDDQDGPRRGHASVLGLWDCLFLDLLDFGISSTSCFWIFLGIKVCVRNSDAKTSDDFRRKEPRTRNLWKPSDVS